MDYRAKAIGIIERDGNWTSIRLEPEYAPGLLALEGFGHVNVLWWCSGCDSDAGRATLQMEAPYKGAPAVMGVFATRSPARPNPIALTAVEVVGIDVANGIVRAAFIDADDGTPVLDIKPYTPSFDRVETPRVPAWCRGWPMSTEASGLFDWSRVFDFREKRP
jgi:tRNA-Thr(GGU) m(6)t(6)A37 methyltransferase TsaA